jgi:hypothetical protein
MHLLNARRPATASTVNRPRKSVHLGGNSFCNSQDLADRQAPRSLCPAPRYAELFSRRHRPNWDGHGDEYFAGDSDGGEP